MKLTHKESNVLNYINNHKTHDYDIPDIWYKKMTKKKLIKLEERNILTLTQLGKDLRRKARKEFVVFTGKEIGALDYINNVKLFKGKNDIPDEVIKKLEKYDLIGFYIEFGMYHYLCLTKKGKTVLKDAKKLLGWKNETNTSLLRKG